MYTVIKEPCHINSIFLSSYHMKAGKEGVEKAILDAKYCSKHRLWKVELFSL